MPVVLKTRLSKGMSMVDQSMGRVVERSSVRSDTLHAGCPPAVLEALGDRYQILFPIGEGFFGTVYRAKDTFLQRTVAVKSVRLNTSPDPALRENLKKRFFREARVAAQLRHPNIVTIHDVISKPQASLIIMEYVDGVSLQSVLDSKQRLDWPATLALVSQVAKALDYAHARKVIHRDIKPANIMITVSKEVRVTDFGIAKTDSSTDLTLAGTIVGTPDYMSPEQAKGAAVDARSDLFSLACVLYKCLTGRKPFESGSVTGVLLRIASEDPPTPVDWRGLGLPPALEGVMTRALAKDPQARFESGADLAQALASLAGETEAKPRPETPGGIAPPDRPSTRKRGLAGQGVSVVPSGQVPQQGGPGQETPEPPHLEALRDEERALCFTPSSQEILHSLDLSPDEAFIISRIDGRSSPGDILKVSPFPERTTARTLLSLIESGLLAFRDRGAEKVGTNRRGRRTSRPLDPADEAKLREINELFELSRFQTHEQILGVDRHAELEQIQQAFKDKSFVYNPDTYPHLEDPDFRQKLRQLLRLTYEAFVALSKRAGRTPELREGQGTGGEHQGPQSPSTRSASQTEPSTRPDREQQAEEIFERAQKAFDREDYWETIQLCRHAIELCRSQAKYHHLLGVALFQNAHWRKDAEESLRKATELDPNNSEYFQVLGTLYEEEGLLSRAKRMFQIAKSLAESA